MCLSTSLLPLKELCGGKDPFLVHWLAALPAVTNSILLSPGQYSLACSWVCIKLTPVCLVGWVEVVVVVVANNRIFEHPPSMQNASRLLWAGWKTQGLCGRKMLLLSFRILFFLPSQIAFPRLPCILSSRGHAEPCGRSTGLEGFTDCFYLYPPCLSLSIYILYKFLF